MLCKNLVSLGKLGGLTFHTAFFRTLCCVFDIMFTFLLCKNLASVGKSGGLENCTVD